MLYSDMLHLRCLLSAEPGHAGKRESRQSDERDYRGVVRVPRRVLQRLLPER